MLLIICLETCEEGAREEIFAGDFLEEVLLTFHVNLLLLEISRPLAASAPPQAEITSSEENAVCPLGQRLGGITPQASSSTS